MSVRLVEIVITKPWPYCMDPDCHNRHTSDYGECGTGNSWPMPMNRLAFIGSQPKTWPGMRRWCKVHAQLNEGWSVG